MRRFWVLGLSVLLSVTMWAVPAYRGGQVVEQANGERITIYQHGDEFCHWLTNEAGETIVLGEDGNYRVAESMTEEQVKAQRAKSPMYQQAQQTRVRKVGALNLAPRGLFILVNYKDTKFQTSNSQAEMDSMMNAVNYTHQTSYGSARRYFIEQSGGKYQPVFDVIGPVTLDNNASYYGANDSSGDDKYPATMILHACQKANEAYPDLNFADYDNDNDGYVDFVYVIYAGKGEADGGAATTIWPHSWSVQSGVYYEGISMNDTKLDGVYLDTYACSGELNGQFTNRRNGIGTLCHEFSHVLGLPDYYETEYGTNYSTGQTPAEWSLMDAGSYNSNGEVPPSYSAYDKWYMGWSEPELLNEGADCQMTANDAGYYITQTGAATTAMTNGLRYVVENRQQSGWDKYLPGHGMLVWKVNYNQSAWDNNTPNNTANAPKITVVSANGSTKNLGNASDPFPGTYRKTSWTPWSNYPITDIKESNGVVTFKFMGGKPRPDAGNAMVLYNIEGMTVTSGPEHKGQVKENEPLVITMEAAEDYLKLTRDNCLWEILADEQVVEAEGKVKNGVLTLTIAAEDVHGYIEVIAIASSHPCLDYSHTFTTQPQYDVETWSGLEWSISSTNTSLSVGYDETKGVSWGTGMSPAKQVSLKTTPSDECAPKSISVSASRNSSGSGAQLAVYINGTQIGATRTLSTSNNTFTFDNTDGLTGEVEIRLTNSKGIMYTKQIVISYTYIPMPTYVTVSYDLLGVSLVSGPEAGSEIAVDSAFVASFQSNAGYEALAEDNTEWTAVTYGEQVGAASYEQDVMTISIPEGEIEDDLIITIRATDQTGTDVRNASSEKYRKILRDGQMLIQVDECTYNLMGQAVK